MSACNATASSADDAEAVQAEVVLKYTGIAVSVLSTFCSTMAFLVIKRSTELEKDLPLCFFNKARRWRKRFWCGFSFNLAAEIGLTSLALSLAPLSVLAPTAALSIVFAAGFAWLGCSVRARTQAPARARRSRHPPAAAGPRERAGLIDFSGMDVAVTGVVITIFGPLGDGIPDMDKLAAAMRRSLFILLTTFGRAASRGCSGG